MTDEKEKQKEKMVYFDNSSLQHIAHTAQKVSYIPGARMEIHGEGKHTFIRFVADGYEGDDINDAKPCPGSPGCP